MRNIFFGFILMVAGLPLVLFAWGQPADNALLEKMRETGANVLRGHFETEYRQVNGSQAANIELAAFMIRGRVVQPGQLFSFNQVAGPYTAERGFSLGDTVAGNRVIHTPGGGVCQVSGTLHNAVLLAGLQVVERHPHSVLVPYIPPGQDAAVTIIGGKDYRFLNNSGGTVLIWSSAEKGVLTVSVYGTSRDYPAAIRHQVLATKPPGEIRQADPDLPRGTEQLIRPGIEGHTIRFWLEIETPQGLVRRELGTNSYSPSPRILRVGPDFRSSKERRNND